MTDYLRNESSSRLTAGNGKRYGSDGGTDRRKLGNNAISRTMGVMGV